MTDQRARSAEEVEKLKITYQRDPYSRAPRYAPRLGVEQVKAINHELSRLAQILRAHERGEFAKVLPKRKAEPFFASTE